jgi:hypothetical protein
VLSVSIIGNQGAYAGIAAASGNAVIITTAGVNVIFATSTSTGLGRTTAWP